MKRSHILATLLLIASFSTAWAVELAPLSGSNLGKVTGGDFTQKAHSVIEKKCVTCHSEQVIKEAMASGKDMKRIQKEMENKGAALSASDREVLGIYWNQEPLKEKK